MRLRMGWWNSSGQSSVLSGQSFGLRCFGECGIEGCKGRGFDPV